MLKLLKSLLQPRAARYPEVPALPAAPPAQVVAPGVQPLDVRAALLDANGVPVFDWEAVQRWVDGIPQATDRAQAWAACELAWLAHLRAALGPGYRVQVEGSAALLSSLPPNVSGAALAFVNKTEQRIARTLDGVALVPEFGHSLLIVFEDDEAYYRYVSHYYPEAGEFAASGGMFINFGCGHFVTAGSELHALEPVIAHELTHACLSHLPIPAWLNEGLAVNTEHRLAPRPRASQPPQRMHARHVGFWGAEEIQQFWSGQSFLRNDDGNELSYDLARILVAQFASDWERFGRFARAARLEDGGASAARVHLGMDLGAAACAVLERDPEDDWSPRPQSWHGQPERGAF